MIILKSIGAFFAKIWRWIKETAWVQPLLIVGAIFAVIFSIPYITSWVSSWSEASEGAFYTTYQVSLEGEDTANAKISKADALTSMIEEATLNHAYDGVDRSKMSKDALAAYQNETYGQIIKEYGEKFFFVYVADNNSTASDFEEGFRFLRDNWNKSNLNLAAHDDKKLDFKIHVINSSEKSANDDDFEITLGKISAFNRYLTNYTELFNVAGPWLFEHMPYVLNNSLAEDTFNHFAIAENVTEFPVPTVCLVDFTLEAIADGRAGLSEVLFNCFGTTANEKAENLLAMWNHTDPYSVKNTWTDTSKREYRVAR
ncbi:MAG: hypothetical protein MJ228_06245 [Bacilli bacterium]|nr:hypothetical protein [Bacilli bacterium]